MLVDDADFADNRDDGGGGFNFNLCDVAALRNLLTGFVGAIPQEGVMPGFGAILAGREIPAANAEAEQVIHRDAYGRILRKGVRNLGLSVAATLARIERVGRIRNILN